MSPTSAPDVSVIVPTWNRPESLRRCLEALAAQDLPRERFEVLVADDGGTRPAAPVVEAMQASLPVQLLVAPHGGPAHARNRAVERARGRWLAFTDDDCRPDPAWLRHLVVALERAPDALVGGRVTNALPDNPFSSASQAVIDLVYAHYNREADAARFFASNNMAIAADAFRALGGFDEGFLVLACEDRELCDRWRAGGGRMIYAPAAVVQHAHGLDLVGFARQHFTYGRGAAHFHRIRAARGSGRLRDEMAFHLDGAGWRGALRGRGVRQGAAMAALLLMWQAANAAGYAWERVAGTGYRRG